MADRKRETSESSRLEDTRRALRDPSELHQGMFSPAYADRTNILDALNQASGRLDALLQTVDAVTALGPLSIFNTMHNPDEYQMGSFEGRPEYVEYIATLLWRRPDSQESQRCTPELEAGIEELVAAIFNHHRLYYVTEAVSETSNQPRVVQEMRMHAIVEGTSSRSFVYSQHLYEILLGLFAPFNEVLLASIGFSIEEALQIARELPSYIQDNFEAFRKQMRIEEKALRQAVRAVRTKRAPEGHWSNEAGLLNDLSKLTEGKLVKRSKRAIRNYGFASLAQPYLIDPETLAVRADVSSEATHHFLQALAMERASFELSDLMPSSTHPLKDRPILAANGLYWGFLPWLFNGALRPTLEKVVMGSGREHAEAYQKHRATFVEQTSLRLLSKALGGVDATHSLNYPDPQSGQETELDGLIQADADLLLIEAKAGGLTPPARRGAPERMLADVRKLLVDAHSQASRAHDYISKTERPIFKASNGERIELDKARIRETILVTVSLEPLDFVTPALQDLRSLGLFRDDASLPWAVSLLDLYVISDLCESPSQFIHYLRRRLRLYGYEKIRGEDELNYFSYYLSSGLDFQDWDLAEPDHIILAGDIIDIERYYLHKLGLRTRPTSAPEWKIPTRLKRLLHEIELVKTAGWIECSCILLDLPRPLWDSIFNVWNKNRERTRKDGKTRGTALIAPSRKSGITVYVGGSQAPRECMRTMEFYSELRKYQVKAESWLGVLEMVGRPGVLLHYNVSPWEEDAILEDLVAKNLNALPVQELQADIPPFL